MLCHDDDKCYFEELSASFISLSYVSISQQLFFRDLGFLSFHYKKSEDVEKQRK